MRHNFLIVADTGLSGGIGDEWYGIALVKIKISLSHQKSGVILMAEGGSRKGFLFR